MVFKSPLNFLGSILYNFLRLRILKINFLQTQSIKVYSWLVLGHVTFFVHHNSVLLSSQIWSFSVICTILCHVFWKKDKVTYSGIWKPTVEYRIPETCEYQTFWSSDFKWFGIQMIGLCAKSYVLVSNTIPVHEKTRWCPFVRYSNGMAGIQIPDHLMSNLFWTIWIPN